ATSGSPAAQARAASCPRSASTCAACRVSRATPRGPGRAASSPRSEEHTSELQSLTNLVCRLLLEKKKTVRLMSAPRSQRGSSRRTLADALDWTHDLSVGRVLSAPRLVAQSDPHRRAPRTHLNARH